MAPDPRRQRKHADSFVGFMRVLHDKGDVHVEFQERSGAFEFGENDGHCDDARLWSAKMLMLRL